MALIYHVAKVDEWENAKKAGVYEHPSLKLEGFIHCAEDYQVSGVLERYFKGMKNLVKLVIDTDKLNSNVVYEWSPSTQEKFPHVYGVINPDAVIDVVYL